VDKIALNSINIDITKSHNDFKLKISNLIIPANGVTGIFGPSGSGKTTFLRCLAGFENFEGQIQIRDQIWQDSETHLKTWLRPIGYVFQEPSLFLHLNVKKNLEYGYSRIPEKKKKIFWDPIIKLLNIKSLLKRNVQDLSGGEKQRVAIGRALLTSPKLLLMDEPLSALDQKSKYEILLYLQKISFEFQVPIFYVSHALDELIKIADRLLLIENGNYLKLGSVEELLCQLDLSLLQGDHSSVLLHGVVEHEEADLGIICLNCDGQSIYVSSQQFDISHKVRIKISAKDVSLSKVKPVATSILNILYAQIFEIKILDHFQILIKLKLNKQFILSNITKKSLIDLDLKIGDFVYVQIKAVNLLINS
jgi:molybdate transport system ATP-binding protein